MISSHLLGVELDRCTPHHGIPEVLYHTSVDFIAEILDTRLLSLDNDWSLVVRVLSLRFGVDPDEIEVLPHPIDELVHVPLQISCNRDVVLDLIEDVEFVEGDGIDLVERIQAGDVFTVAFNHIDNVVFGSVAFDQHICVTDLVFLENGLNSLVADSVGVYHTRNRNSPLVFSLEINLRRLLVESDSEALKLVLDDLLMSHGPGRIEDNDNQITGSGHGNNLLASTLAVLGSLNNTRQVQQLDLGAFVVENTRDTGQSGELVCCDFREGS